MCNKRKVDGNNDVIRNDVTIFNLSVNKMKIFELEKIYYITDDIAQSVYIVKSSSHFINSNGFCRKPITYSLTVCPKIDILKIGSFLPKKQSSIALLFA